MHELSIAMNIVEIAEHSAAKEGASKVTAIELEIGTLSGVILEALEFAMESAVKGTMLENAAVKYNVVSGKAKCNACGHIFDTNDRFTPCPACGHPFSEVIAGKELKVKSLNIE